MIALIVTVTIAYFVLGMYIIHKILMYMNYKYGKRTNKQGIWDETAREKAFKQKYHG